MGAAESGTLRIQLCLPPFRTSLDKVSRRVAWDTEHPYSIMLRGIFGSSIALVPFVHGFGQTQLTLRLETELAPRPSRA